MKRSIYIIVFVMSFTSLLISEINSDQRRSLPIQRAFTTSDIFMDVNRMNGRMRNNGIWFRDMVGDFTGGKWGLEWPKGSGLSPCFAGGQWIAAKVDQEIRVAGTLQYISEFQPGMILPDGTADNWRDEKYRWYIIEPDGAGDWDSWPVDQGAPLDDSGNPLLIGDKTAFCVWNDLGDHSIFSTNKLGVEVRQLVFAFNRGDAIGDMVFFKWQMINKSDADWDSTYFAILLDPDLGNGWDDFVGCDPPLNLGYCYNATNFDQQYGAMPPAIGVDYFQGPMVDEIGSTVTLSDGTLLQDKKMLNMTAFIYYNNDTSPQGDPQTSGDVWNFFNGRWRDGSNITEGGDGTNPDNPSTSFMFDGDPEAVTGWLDSNASDRRFLMSTGPFDMKKWEDINGNGLPDFCEPGVQEILAGVMVGRGSSHINSVSFLKAIDDAAQNAYDINFALPDPPSPPQVTVSELSNEVILTWDDRSELNADNTPYEAIDVVANGLIGQHMVVGDEYKIVDDGTFNFARYRVFQYSSATLSDPVLCATLGRDEVKDEPYSGRRFVRFLMNVNPVVGNVGDPLINGKTYYFGVQADSYLEFAKPDQYFSSAVTLVEVIPRAMPGVRYQSDYQDTVANITKGLIDPSGPEGEGSVIVWIVDPSEVTGHDYQVQFSDTGTTTVWHLKDLTTEEYALTNQLNQSGDDAYTIVDGLMVQVVNPMSGIKTVAELDPTTGQIYTPSVWGYWNIYGLYQGWPTLYCHETSSEGLSFDQLDYFDMMPPNDYEFIFTDDDSTLIWDYSTNQVLKDTLTGEPSYVPFTCWRVDLYGTRSRLPVCILDADGSGTWNRTYGGLWGPSFEPLFVYDNVEYRPENLNQYVLEDDGTVVPGYGPYGTVYPAVNGFCFGMYIDFYGNAQPEELDGNGYFWGPPHAGEQIKIITYKPNTSNDVFSFTAPSEATLSLISIKEDMEKIKVVPNPYYGYHSGEMDAFDRWVQFTYLPEKCTIHIFDLAGNVIRKLEKDDATTPFLRWDLHNEYDLPVSSGVYVFIVEVPDVGMKTGKIAVFTPNERLDTY